MKDPMFTGKAKIVEMYVYARKGVAITVLEPVNNEQWAKFEHAFQVAIQWYMTA